MRSSLDLLEPGDGVLELLHLRLELDHVLADGVGLGATPRRRMAARESGMRRVRMVVGLLGCKSSLV